MLNMKIGEYIIYILGFKKVFLQMVSTQTKNWLVFEKNWTKKKSKKFFPKLSGEKKKFQSLKLKTLIALTQEPQHFY